MFAIIGETLFRQIAGLNLLRVMSVATNTRGSHPT